MGSAAPEDFRARARAEADRYGPDPWVFVRELLQNARDAGATSVVFHAEVEGGRWRLRCRDDGEGMSYAHARRYLFALYASSKEQRRDQVGRFGVGFWSILRFEPERIVIRSRPRVSAGTGPSEHVPEDSSAWELELAGDLESAAQRGASMEPGTEVVLERTAPDGELERRVYEAAWQNARFLATRDRPDQPLRVSVNGRPVNARFELPAPSSAFRRGSVRGVVGLGTAARVELFSRGLRVRAAASLADFTAGGGRHTGRSRVQFAELSGRFAPQALLESDALELLLSRSDARDNKALRKLVRLAERELARLIARQLDAVRPMAWWRRIWFDLRLRLRDSLALRTALAAGFGAAAALAVAWGLWGDHAFAQLRDDFALFAGGDDAIAVGAAGDMSPRYTDLGRLYRGPQVDVLSGSGVPVELSYEPSAARYYFAALILARLDAEGQAAASAPTRLAPYVAPTGGCPPEGCTAVALVVESPGGVLRLPVPTGHRVDPASLRLDDAAPQLFATEDDEPTLLLPGATRGTLRYATVPAAPLARSPRPRESGLLPDELRQRAAALRGRPVGERVQQLLDLTRERVTYSNAPAVAARHQAADLQDLHFIARTLRIGAGDCDMQNALLVALLQEADVPARMAIGFVGQDGRTNSWLHAWAEYRDGDGPWAIADASASARPFALIGPGDAATPTPIPPVPQDTSSEPAGEPTPGAGETDVSASATPPPAAPPSAPESPQTGPPALDPDAPPPGPSNMSQVPASARIAVSAELRRWFGRAALLGLAGALLGLVVALARRTRRQVALELGHDLSRLLQGALQQPEAFRGVPAVFQRPLVPTARGPAISLDDARALAGKGRLYRTRDGSDLARRAVAGGARVLEDRVPEARAVADALGAIDLDPWDRMLAAAPTAPLAAVAAPAADDAPALALASLLAAINAAIRATGERLVVIAAQGLTEEVRSLDLQPLHLRGSAWHGRRVIAVAPDNPWLRDAAAALVTRPHAAVFAALDYLADRLDLPAEPRARLLHAAARAAVQEAAT